MLLLEKCGELSKAVRKAKGVKTENASENFKIGEELADIFWYTAEIASRFGVNLESAFWEKKEKNNQRKWS